MSFRWTSHPAVVLMRQRQRREKLAFRTIGRFDSFNRTVFTAPAFSFVFSRPSLPRPSPSIRQEREKFRGRRSERRDRRGSSHGTATLILFPGGKTSGNDSTRSLRFIVDAFYWILWIRFRRSRSIVVFSGAEINVMGVFSE